MNLQEELLYKTRKKLSLSSQVCEAYLALPRHRFLDKFSVDDENWLEVKAQTLPLIYADTTLLLYHKDQFVSTMSRPSFVLRLLDLLDIQPMMKVFELGTGSGWNAAMMGHLTGPQGQVISFEIIPEMCRQAQAHLAQFDLPQVEIRQGDALQEIWEIENFDRGIFTAGLWDLPGIFFDVLAERGKFLFVLKTSYGDLLLAMEKKSEYFAVFEKIPCTFVSVTGECSQRYYNNLDQLYHVPTPFRIYPQGALNIPEKSLAGRDMVFSFPN